jgi:hypothetical protein
VAPEKQQRAYGILMFFVVVLLLGAQFILQYTLRQASDELVSVKTSLSSEEGTLTAQRSLNDRYKIFQQNISGQAGTDRKFPVNGIELYTAVSKVLTDYDIEFNQGSSTAGVQPGANFTLQITIIKGQYYNVIKALAAIRESSYIMRISQLSLQAEGAGAVRGTMNIVSTAQAQS